ncbi:MAG: cytochrome c-type biogenesis protein [Solirubrobacterales bacterium]
MAALALAAPAGAQENNSSPSISAAPPASGSAELQTDLADLEDEIMCPICGTALGLSESPQADRERAYIRELIAEGRTKDEIKDALVAEYGDEVLAVPGTDGFDLAAWVVPGVALLLAAVAIFVGLRRWRGVKEGGDGIDVPEKASDEDRLNSDMARYDL